MKNKERKFTLTMSDLIDKLTIDQIKEVMLNSDVSYNNSISKEMKNIEHDIDLIINEKKVKMSSKLIRIIIVISQLNLHIWYNKDKMQSDKKHYSDLLKYSHQLNGIRNHMKNLLLEEIDNKEKSAIRTNFNTDGLKWNVSV